MAYCIYNGSGTLAVSASNFGYGNGLYTSCLNASSGDRIYMDGTVREVRIKTSDIGDSLTDVVGMRQWRDTNQVAFDAGTYVASSPVTANTLVDNTWTALTTPFTVEMGDCVGITYRAVAGKKLGTTSSELPENSKSFYYAGLNVNTESTLTWNKLYTGRPLIDCQGDKAEIVTYGDSISIGTSNDATSMAGSLNSDFWYNLKRNPSYGLVSLLRRLLGLSTCVAAGMGSQNAVWGNNNWATRITPYAAPGCKVVVNFGINEIAVNSENEEDLAAAWILHQAAWDNMLVQALADGVTLVRQSVLHVRDDYILYAGAPVINPIVDTWNTAMATWCTNNGVLNIDVTTRFTKAALANELISEDAIHPSWVGYERIAGMLAESIRNTDPGIGYVLKDTTYQIIGAAKVGTFPSFTIKLNN